MQDSPGSVLSGGILPVHSNKWLVEACGQWDILYEDICTYLRTHNSEKERSGSTEWKLLKLKCCVQYLAKVFFISAMTASTDEVNSGVAVCCL